MTVRKTAYITGVKLAASRVFAPRWIVPGALGAVAGAVPGAISGAAAAGEGHRGSGALRGAAGGALLGGLTFAGHSKLEDALFRASLGPRVRVPPFNMAPLVEPFKTAPVAGLVGGALGGRTAQETSRTQDLVAALKSKLGL